MDEETFLEPTDAAYLRETVLAARDLLKDFEQGQGVSKLVDHLRDHARAALDQMVEVDPTKSWEIARLQSKIQQYDTVCGIIRSIVYEAQEIEADLTGEEADRLEEILKADQEEEMNDA